MPTCALSQSLSDRANQRLTPTVLQTTRRCHGFHLWPPRSNRRADPILADARASILSQILFPDAADRLHRIRMVKESRATEVENRLIFMVRSGQLRERVTEEQLKQLLGAMNESNEKESEGKIVVNRRRTALDDDDDDLEGL